MPTLRPIRAQLGLLALALLFSTAAAAAPKGLQRGVARVLDYEQKMLSREVDLQRISGTKNKQDPRYAPETARTFTIQSYWLDADSVEAHEGNGLPVDLRTRFFRTHQGKTQVLLLVHPESEKFYAKQTAGAERGPDYEASATASSRTLVAWPRGYPEQAVFAKLSLDKEIGNIVRTIPGSEVARSIGVNNMLAADKATLPSSFRFLPEVLGVIPKGMDRGGMILRAIPADIASGKTHYVPLFSLYAERADGKPPLIVEMIEKSGLPAADFVTQRIIIPFVRQWWSMVLDHQAVMEPHAQNVLIEVGSDGLPTGGFLHRDLGGFRVDFRARAKMGLASSVMPLINDRKRDYKEDEFKANLGSSFYNYFEGGFIHNLDTKLPGWARQYGYTGFKRGALSTALQRAVETEYADKTGVARPLVGGLHGIAALAEAAFKSAARPTRPSQSRTQASPTSARRESTVTAARRQTAAKKPTRAAGQR